MAGRTPATPWTPVPTQRCLGSRPASAPSRASDAARGNYPPSATALDVQALVKAKLGIKVQHQRLAVGNSVIEGLAPLSLYTAEELGNITLV